MKKIGIVLIVSLSLLITGCDAEYNLTIEKNQMIESVDFLLDDIPANQPILKNYLKSNYMAYYDMDNRKTNNYEKKAISNDDEIGMNLTYSYTSDNLKKSSLLDRCYYKKTITKTEDTIIINTDGKTTCFYKDDSKYLDKLIINIKTNLKVLEQNADKVKGNTYTWVIDDSNLNNHPIMMKIDTTPEKEGMSMFMIISLCVLGGVIIAFILIGGFIYIKNNKNNKL